MEDLNPNPMPVLERPVTMDTIVLPARLDVRCADDKQYRLVMDDLKRYRAAARQAFCAFVMAHIAGARIEHHANGTRVTPNNDAAKAILAKTMGMSVQQRTKPAVAKALKTVADILSKLESREKLGETYAARLDQMLTALSDAATQHNWAQDISDEGAAPCYEVRDFVLNDLLPDWRPFCFDSLRREVLTVWTGDDPEHTKATRGWLMLNGARFLARFNRLGIEFPILSGAHTFDSNSITLEWRKGVSVKFNLMDMERQRWQQWTDARDGVCDMGSLQLVERDGRLRIIIPLHRKILPRDVDRERVATISIEGGALKTVARGMVDILPLNTALGQMRRIKKEAEYFDTMKRPTGSPVKKWGAKYAFRTAQDRIHRRTTKRAYSQSYWNHLWSRRSVDVCIRSRCGTIRLELPKKSELVPDIPWSWKELKNLIEYKAKLAGISVEQAE